MNPEILKQKEVTKEEQKLMEKEVKRVGGGGPVQKYESNMDLSIKNKEALLKVAEYLYQCKLVPDSFSSPESVFLGIHTAMGFGFKLFGNVYRALTQMFVLKGVVQIWGDLPLAIVRQTGELSYFKEHFLNEKGEEISIENKNFNDLPACAVCIASRSNEETKTFFLSKRELEAAEGEMNEKGQWNMGEKKIPWKKHPYTMWLRRCRKKMINDLFPDVMYGIKVYEYDGIDTEVKNSDNKEMLSQVKQDFLEAKE